MAQFVVTADDREWFGRCRRAWDLGARRPAGPRCPAPPPLEPAGSLERGAARAALAVHYFPGMWAGTARSSSRSSSPRTTRPAGRADGRPLLEEFLRWAPRRRSVHAAAGRGRHRRARPRSGAPRHPPGHARGRRGPLPGPHRPRDGRRRRPLLARRPPRGRRVRRRRRVACSTSAASSRAGPGTRSSWRRRSPASSTRRSASIRRRSGGRSVPRSARREGRRGEPARREPCWRCSTADLVIEPDARVGALRAVPVPRPVHRDEPGRRRRGRCSRRVPRARPRRPRGRPPRAASAGAWAAAPRRPLARAALASATSVAAPLTRSTGGQWAAMAAWPMLMPPSFGGHPLRARAPAARRGRARAPTTSVRRTFWNTPPVSDDRVDAARRARSRRATSAAARPMVSWNAGREHRRRRYPLALGDDAGRRAARGRARARRRRRRRHESPS